MNAAASFVQNNYYCEAANGGGPLGSSYYTHNRLWDGVWCEVNSNCCSDVGLPWFFRQFPLAQEENIEVRLCHDEPFSNEGVLLAYNSQPVIHKILTL